MKRILEYQIQQKLYESHSTIVFRAGKENGDSIILKVLKPELPDKEEIGRYHNEYSITQTFQASSRIIKTYGLECFNDTFVMLVEDFGATSLDLLLNQTHFSLEQVLDIAFQVIEGLDEIHSAGIIHKDINPSNIVMNPDNGKVKIIDFGIASAFIKEENRKKNSNMVEGTLSYIPPEQTGRIKRKIDHRADSYSLGATIYELLAHKPPFNKTKPMDLIHCHLAQIPIPLSVVRSDIPEPVSKIVMKLMSKDAEERYATAKGVKVDLQKCIGRVKKGEQDFSFPIGDEDSRRILKIVQKNFGRKKEREQLQSTFRQVYAGEKNLVVVKGPAGIGKTFLIKELEQHVVKNNSIFISGKFNRLQQAIPYTGIIQALQRLARHLLVISDHELYYWQKRITAALGNQGYELIELVPEFKKILGSKSPIPDLGGQEARNRLYLMVENFLSVFARKDQPLVIFLDDLHWVDPSSLEIIKQIVSSPVIKYLCIICAFRDNEVTAGHPLETMFESLKKEEVEFKTIALFPLDLPSVSQLIAKSLGCSLDNAHPLAQWVHTRSLGNPFYSKELLFALNEQKKLIFDIRQNMWKWDIREIQAMSLPESITKLLAKKIQNLSEKTQNLLMMAACVGTNFELSILTIVCECSQYDIIASLKQSMEAGLILQMNDNLKSLDEKKVKEVHYQFVHDRIHAAAYHLMSKDQKPKIHWQIGQLLLRNLPQGQMKERIFEIANHLNKSRTFLVYGPEKKELACLNLEAGQKAKASAAFDQAYAYFKIGINLLESTNDPDLERKKFDACHWQESYALISTLYFGAIETAFLSNRFNEVENLGKIMLDNAATVLDQLRVYGIMIQAFHAQNIIKKAVSTAIHSLGLVGIYLSKKPHKWDVGIEYLKTWYYLYGQSRKNLDDIKETVKNSEKLAALRIIQDACISLAFIDNTVFNANLFSKMIFMGIRFCVRYGDSADRAFGFSGYAFISSGVLGNLETGYQFSRKAIDIAKHFEKSKLYPAIMFAASYNSIHMKKHLKEALPYLSEAHGKGLEIGDFGFSAIAAHFITINRFLIGENLTSVQKAGEAYQGVIKRIKQKTIQQYQSILLQTISNPVFDSRGFMKFQDTCQ